MLSTTAEYALRIMVALAGTQGEPMTSVKIAVRTGVPPDYSVKVLRKLAQAGLVHAQRGRGGGFMLDREPQRLTLLEIVRAIDQREPSSECPLSRELVNGRMCSLHRALEEITAALESRLERLTLAALTDGAEGPPLCPTVTIPRRVEVPPPPRDRAGDRASPPLRS